MLNDHLGKMSQARKQTTLFDVVQFLLMDALHFVVKCAVFSLILILLMRGCLPSDHLNVRDGRVSDHGVRDHKWLDTERTLRIARIADGAFACDCPVTNLNKFNNNASGAIDQVQDDGDAGCIQVNIYRKLSNCPLDWVGIIQRFGNVQSGRRVFPFQPTKQPCRHVGQCVLHGCGDVRVLKKITHEFASANGSPRPVISQSALQPVARMMD